jgi:hypothetical protein
MQPEAGPDRSSTVIEAQLEEVAVDPGGAAGWLGDPALAAKVPDRDVRAGVAALTGTVAEPAIHELVDGGSITTLGHGTPDGRGRIVGRRGSDAHRVLNDRYRHEHVGLVAGPLAHEILCHPEPRCDAEEKLLHGVLAMVHMQLLARAPRLAGLGTELTRRINSMTLSLFNSRRPGSPRFTLIAPDGPGTIPGGRPSMQTPDFWSIPFLTGHPEPVPVPSAVIEVLGRLGVHVQDGVRRWVYADDTARAVDQTPGLDWLGWEERGAVGSALGVL